jgi:hypothetical protein
MAAPDQELVKQVARELAELAAAPAVPSAGLVLRCGFCGQLTGGGSEIRGPVAVNGELQIRFRGSCCGG